MNSCIFTTTFEMPIKNSRIMKIWKVKEIIDYITKDGWYFLRQKGSHRQFRPPIKRGTVTVHGKLNEDLLPNTAKSIMKQAELL